MPTSLLSSVQRYLEGLLLNGKFSAFHYFPFWKEMDDKETATALIRTLLTSACGIKESQISLYLAPPNPKKPPLEYPTVDCLNSFFVIVKHKFIVYNYIHW